MDLYRHELVDARLKALDQIAEAWRDHEARQELVQIVRRPTLRFLPPYSPDFNPIEKAFSRLKAMLRKAGERTVRGLWDLIGRLVDIFEPAECANYFRSCGYEPE
jgi:transposase